MLLLTTFAGGCVRVVKVAQPLQARWTASVDDLVGHVNGLAQQQRTVNAPITLRFRDLTGAVEGTNKEYPAADGRLVLQRPSNIRLQVKAPLVGKRIADMASDGERFEVAVLWPDDKRKFIVGSNAANYKRVDAGTQSADPALQRAGTLANIRPQHLTNAFLVEPVALDGADSVYFLDDIRQVERDTRPKAKRGDEVERPFYVLTLLARVDGGPEARVVRRLWFDRSAPGIELARQEVYENGRIATRISYSDFMTIEGGGKWPGRVRIERLSDAYSVEVIFGGSGLTLNNEVPEEAFNLTNEENLPVIDLDKLPGVTAPGGAAE